MMLSDGKEKLITNGILGGELLYIGLQHLNHYQKKILNNMEVDYKIQEQEFNCNTIIRTRKIRMTTVPFRLINCVAECDTINYNAYMEVDSYGN